MRSFTYFIALVLICAPSNQDDTKTKRSLLYQGAQSYPYPSLNVWRPPIQQLSRPYFIPILMGPGGNRIFYPPQPIQQPPYRGPGYLPPQGTPMTIGDRFNGGDNTDEPYVFDGNSVSQGGPNRLVPPTREDPPLVHKPTDPVRTTPAPPRPQPSKCVWAIISCCSGSNTISYDCFEQRGCVGAFWDTNPCDSDFARAAIAAALNYYNE